MEPRIPNQSPPESLQKLQLTEEQFRQRFQLIHEIEDPYVRVYDISRDLETNLRVAVRSYTAAEENQENDVLENMESFRKLGEEEGMSKLVAFTKREEAGIISAAFQYNDFSIEELLESRYYEKERYELYIAVLRGMLKIIGSTSLYGVVIEEIIPACILVQSVGTEFHLKLLYDEREKRYEKIQEGLKVLASPDKIYTVLNGDHEYESVESEQAIFELGLLMLDIIYEFQVRASTSEEGNIFMKDAPIQRSNLSHRGYLLFQHFEHSVRVDLNQSLVNQKLIFLHSLGVPYIDQLVDLVKGMIEPLNSRIPFEQALQQAQLAHQLLIDTLKNRQKNSISIDQNSASPGKESINIGKQSITIETENKRTVRKKEDFNTNHQTAQEKKTVISQTTIASPNFIATADSLPKHLGPISDTKAIQIFIPREPLLSKARKCTQLLPKFQEFISRLQDRPGIVKKEYLDGGMYYGSINGNGKREGFGIYIYNTNDIYFGIWKQNLLIDGNYLFQNGESFEGVVKNGKQGFGRYCYSNGNVYEGEWRDDVKNGMGIMKYPNGDVYDGMWNKGKKNGQGKYYYSNKTTYVGNFVDGKKNGFGVITFPNGTKIEAYWNQTHIEGPGKVFYSNGNYFEGNYHLSQKQGKGCFKWQDTQYEGEFKKDLMEGHACIRFSDKEYYEGRIKNGKRDGKGAYHYANGDEFAGDWRNDEKVFGHYKFHEGGSFEGRFKNNELSYGVMVYQNGETYEGEFLRGERHGLGVYKGGKSEMLYQGKWQRDQFVAAL